MSQENLEILREFYDALNRGDWDAASGLLLQEFEWETDPRHPEAGVYRGHKAFRRFLESLDAPFEHVVTEIEDSFARGDQVVLFVRIRRRPAGSSSEIEIQIGELWTVRGAKLVRGQGFRRREQALEAAELSE